MTEPLTYVSFAYGEGSQGEPIPDSTQQAQSPPAPTQPSDESGVYEGADGYIYASPQLTMRAYRASAGIPSSLLDCDFHNFQCEDNGRIMSAQQAAFGRVAEWYGGLRGAIRGNRVHSIMLHGPTGTGKTHLGVACLKNAVEHGLMPKFVDGPAMMLDLRTDWGDVAGEYAGVPCLMIDDLGASAGTEAVVEKLRVILMKRYAEVRPTIITSNLAYPTQLAKLLGERVLSRMAQCYASVIFHPNCGDWRQRSRHASEGLPF